MVAILTKAFQYNYCTTNLQRQGDARWRVHRTQGVSIMIEFLIGFIVAAGVATAAVDLTTDAYNYVEPKVQQGVDYVQEKLD